MILKILGRDEGILTNDDYLGFAFGTDNTAYNVEFVGNLADNSNFKNFLPNDEQNRKSGLSLNSTSKFFLSASSIKLSFGLKEPQKSTKFTLIFFIGLIIMSDKISYNRFLAGVHRIMSYIQCVHKMIE